MLVHLNNGKAINIQDIESVECQTHGDIYFVVIKKYKTTEFPAVIHKVVFNNTLEANNYIYSQFKMPIFF